MNETSESTLSLVEAEALLDRVAERHLAPAAAVGGEGAAPGGRKRMARLTSRSDEPGGDARRAFMRAVLCGDVLGQKALAERTSTGTRASGGCLVPEEFREEIITGLYAASELAPHVRVVPVRAESGRLPRLAANVAVAWGGKENAEFNEVDPTVDEIPWRLKRADVLTKLSRELAADAPDSLVDFLTAQLREALAASRDRMIVAGNGTSQPLGIAVDPQLTTAGRVVEIDGALSYDVFVDLEQKLPRPYRARARWIMNGTNVRRLRLLKDGDGRPLFHRDLVAGRPETSLLGYPLAQADALADDVVLFGDLSQYLWFDREELGAESSTVAGGAFENHQVWIKVWERVDGRIALPEAFVKATGVSAAVQGD